VSPLGRIALVAALLSCSGSHERARERVHDRLSIRGSDTMLVLVQRWAERYMQLHPAITIEVAGGGSGTGLAALHAGTVEIAAASRPLSAREQRTMPDARATPVAVDALAIYVHRDAAIRALTLAQLADLFTGRVDRWSSVGGGDAPVVLYGRENSSGTYAFFKERVLGGRDFSIRAQSLPGTAAILHALSRDPNGIGYGGIGYGGGARTVALVGEEGTPVEPTIENTLSGRYPLSRELHLVTRGEPRGTARDFVAFVLSAEGQALVREVGFYPLPSVRHAAR
jgi:phosphate transport system substrate-binding protein